MGTKDVRARVEQLGELTEVQRSVLTAELPGQGSANEALATIEMGFALALASGHCNPERFGGWGKASWLKRYRCRDCGPTFNALTGPPLARVHRRGAWFDYARAKADRTNQRKAAERVEIRLDTSFRWRRRFLKAARDKRPSLVTGILGSSLRTSADEAFILGAGWRLDPI